jgi:internalin A
LPEAPNTDTDIQRSEEPALLCQNHPWVLVVEEPAMKRLLFPALSLLVMAGLSFFPAVADAGPVTIPDKKLEEAIRAALREPKAPLTDENLINLFVLEAPAKEITDLSGLEKCKNLALIKLTGNQIADLKALKELTNLQSLDLAKNKIADVAPLTGLTRLQYLELSNNQIEKVDALSPLVNLSALYLSGNKIKDLTPLGGLTKLSSLYLDHNQVSDLAPLAKVTKLSTLDLKDNAIVDVTPLAKQTELRMLFLQRNKITDLAPLVSAAKADAEGEKRFAPYLHLYLAGNPLADAAKNTQLPALKGFGVRLED